MDYHPNRYSGQIHMLCLEDGKVVMSDQYQPDGKCVWEYDILGLISVGNTFIHLYLIF